MSVENLENPNHGLTSTDVTKTQLRVRVANIASCKSLCFHSCKFLLYYVCCDFYNSFLNSYVSLEGDPVKSHSTIVHFVSYQ
jgi:hypothetical protein